MMKNPRQISGQARPEQGDPPRQLTVRLVQGPMRRREDIGDIVSDFPKDAVVHLVAVDKKGVPSIQSQTVDAGGRAVFDGLVADGSVSYYALALLPREGAVDRVESRPLMMPPEVGMRMILAGHGITSGKAPADDVMGDDRSWLAPTYDDSQVQTFFGTVVGANHGYIQGTVGGVPGGVETPAMIAWLRYWIYNDQGAKKYFYGDDCVMCDAPWTDPKRKNWQ
jgi:hypothetical protein